MVDMMYDLQRRDRHASSPQLCQIRRDHPPPFPVSVPVSASHHQNTCLYTKTHAHTNIQTQRCPSLPTLNTNTAWPWYHNKTPVLGIRSATFSQQPLLPFLRSNDMALCPVTYITLAGCHTKNAVSRLMPGLRFTGNISHIFAVKTMGNMRRKFKVKFSHYS